MCDIIDVIEADRLHITRWAERLGELSRQDSDQESGPILVRTWQTLASLIELHMRVDEEICGPAVVGADVQGRALAREIRDGREDIREIIRETSLQPPGSPPWRYLARAALAAWAVQLDREARGPLAERRRRSDPALRERLAGQWRAFTEAHIRDQYPQPPPDTPPTSSAAIATHRPPYRGWPIRPSARSLAPAGPAPARWTDDLPPRRTRATAGGRR